MREVTVNLAGTELSLRANFAASLAIAAEVGDPMTIMREAALEAMFLSRGIPYEPKWRFTLANTVALLMIGLKAAGSKMQKKEVEELVFDAGFADAKEAAAEYLATIVGPRPEEVAEGATDSGN